MSEEQLIGVLRQEIDSLLVQYVDAFELGAHDRAQEIADRVDALVEQVTELEDRPALRVTGKIKQEGDGWRAYAYAAGVPVLIGEYETREGALYALRSGATSEGAVGSVA